MWSSGLVLTQHNIVFFLLSTQPGATGTLYSYFVDRTFDRLKGISKSLQSGILNTGELAESKIDFDSINYSHSPKKLISNVRSTGARAQHSRVKAVCSSVQVHAASKS